MAEEHKPDVIVLVHVEGCGMAGHVSIGYLFEHGKVPEWTGYTRQIERDEEFIGIAKDSLFGEILKR